jgi:sulfide:quinone oxidoreductase
MVIFRIKNKMNNKKHVVILGSGTAGAMLANKMAKNNNIMVTVIDDAEWHYYQPGFLFAPFGLLDTDKLSKPTADVLSKKVYWLNSKAKDINTEANLITTEDGSQVEYDALVIATGTRGDASITEGMMDEAGWRKNIFDFYSPDGAEALKQALQAFTGGRLVVQITEMPIKCPVAPLEFTFLVDDYLKKHGLRDQTQVSFVTPLSGAFTKPVASEKLGHLLVEKNIETIADFYIEKVDAKNNKLVCYDGREVEYDLLVTIPTNVGAKIMQGQDFTDDLGFVEVDPHTLQSTKVPSIFAIGDSTNVATSKAGSVAHFEADIVEENVLSYLDSQPLEAAFDGHSNCFVEVGGGKALLLDFNYETQPYEGKFPFAVIGPMSLLKESRLNHIGKLLFRYIYWYLLIPGRPIPLIPNKMSLKGKKIINDNQQ